MICAPADNSVVVTAVGERFANADGSSRQAELALCRSGDPVLLRREPYNPADPLAVAVYTERLVQVGYLRRDNARMVAAVIDAGGDVTASVVSVAPRARPFSPLALTLRMSVSA